MSGLTTITWKSITMLPVLIGVSVVAAFVIGVVTNVSPHLGAGLLVSALAVAEIGYLCILIVVNRRDAARGAPAAPER